MRRISLNSPLVNDDGHDTAEGIGQLESQRWGCLPAEYHLSVANCPPHLARDCRRGYPLVCADVRAGNGAPELGVSQPIGNWFVEGAAGVWLYTENRDFFGGRRRSQEPMPVFQWHGGYTWRPGLWIAADMTYFTGGRTSVNGVQDQDLQRSVRYGVTLSVPLSAQWSAKLAWSHGLITRVGGNFQTVSVALQYRWFNH